MRLGHEGSFPLIASDALQGGSRTAPTKAQVEWSTRSSGPLDRVEQWCVVRLREAMRWDRARRVRRSRTHDNGQCSSIELIRIGNDGPRPTLTIRSKYPCSSKSIYAPQDARTHTRATALAVRYLMPASYLMLPLRSSNVGTVNLREDGPRPPRGKPGRGKRAGGDLDSGGMVVIIGR